MKWRFTLAALCLSAALVSLNGCKEEQTTTAATPPQKEATSLSYGEPSTQTAGVNPATQDKEIIYQCGDKVVRFRQSGASGKGDMSIENTAYAMEQVKTASGAKYTNLGDETTYLWSKGNEATVMINGNALPDCVENPEAGKIIKPIKAYGNEPGWNLTIDKKQAVFVSDYGQKTITLPITDDHVDQNVRVLTASKDGETMRVTLETKQCADDMSGEQFANTVQVVYGGTTYQGCAQSTIRDKEWLLEDISNKGIIDNSHLTLYIEQGGRLYGDTGCNRYSGGYTMEGNTLTVNPNMVMTMRACMAEALMNQERFYTETLTKMTHIKLDDTGALILSNDAGESLKYYPSENE